MKGVSDISQVVLGVLPPVGSASRVVGVRDGGQTTTIRVTAAAMALLLVLAAGCSDSGGDGPERASVPTDGATTTTTSTSSTTTTVAAGTTTFEPLIADPNQTPEQQVEAAYLYSWEVYLDAAARGDTSALSVVYRGPALEVVRKEIEEFVSSGHRVSGDVEFNYVTTVQDDNFADVVDAYRNHLVLIDAGTGQPLEDDPNEEVVFHYTLERVDGTWFVTSLTSYS